MEKPIRQERLEQVKEYLDDAKRKLELLIKANENTLETVGKV